MSRIQRVLILVALFLSYSAILTSSIHAATIISNLAGGDRISSNISGTSDKAMGFSMPIGQDYYLDSVTMRLSVQASFAAPTVQIWSNDGANNPGSPLLTLTAPTLTGGGIANYNFTAPSSFQLQDGSTYWVVAYGGTGISWPSDAPSVTPTGYATHFGARNDTDGPPPTIVSGVLNTYAVDATVGNDSTISTSGGTVDLGKYLLNAVGSNIIVNSAATKTGSSTTTFTFTPSNAGLTVSPTSGSLASGNASVLAIMSLTNGSSFGLASYGTKNFTVTVDNTATTSAAANQGSLDANDTINVTAIVGEAATAGTSFGAPLTGFVTIGGSYSLGDKVHGLASRTTTSGSGVTKVLGSEAVMLNGSNSTGSFEMVSMKWRTRRPSEVPVVYGGSAAAPPLPGTGGPQVAGLLSDVVDLTGMTAAPSGGDSYNVRTDPYVLQMSYDPTQLVNPGREHEEAVAGLIFLGSLNRIETDPTAVWVNAINLNFATNTSVTQFKNFQGSYAAYVSFAAANPGLGGTQLTIGAWGVDESANTVWAIIDHNSEFGVVPEPSSFVLLGIGALGLLIGRRRVRR